MICGIITSLHCRKPVLPIEQELLNTDGDSTDLDVDSYMEKMEKLREDMFVKADDNIKDAQAKQKKEYDRRHHNRKVCIWVRIHVIHYRQFSGTETRNDGTSAE